jgi:hypothetical protein
MSTTNTTPLSGNHRLATTETSFGYGLERRASMKRRRGRSNDPAYDPERVESVSRGAGYAKLSGAVSSSGEGVEGHSVE